MGFSERGEIAASLDAVPGVKGYAYKPAAPKLGDAWLRWRGNAHDPSAGVKVTTWEVVVAIPMADSTAQEQWISAREDALYEALQPVAFVDTMEPGTAGDTPALLITVRE